MSTQSGGQAAANSGVVYDTNNATVQSFFSNPVLGQVNLQTADPVTTGVTTYTTSTGAVVTMVGDDFVGSSLRVPSTDQTPVVGAGAANGGVGWGQVVVGTNTNTEIVGSNGENNIFITDAAFHVVKAGGGSDTIQSAGTGGGAFYGANGNDNLIAGGGTVLLDGGNGADRLVAGTGANRLLGGNGNDTLVGGEGTAVMKGGSGNDDLIAGSGNNIMTGGSGKDDFVFGQHSTSGGVPYLDHITDFHKGDTLDLSARVGQFQIVQSGKDALVNFSNGDQIILHNVKASKLHDQNDDGIFSI